MDRIFSLFAGSAVPNVLVYLLCLATGRSFLGRNGGSVSNLSTMQYCAVAVILQLEFILVMLCQRWFERRFVLRRRARFIAGVPYEEIASEPILRYMSKHLKATLLVNLEHWRKEGGMDFRQ